MNIKEQVKDLFYRNKLLKLFLVIAMVLNSYSLKSQESAIMVYPLFGLSVGVFNPGDVNDYISSDLSNVSVSSGFKDIVAYYEVQGGLTLRIKWLDVSGFFQYATAPKWIIITNGENRTYFFNRTTFGVTSNIYFPLKTGRNAFFLGGGVNYNIMKFEEFSASAPGFRIQAGVSMQFGKFNLQPYLAYNHSKATDTPANFELDYTGGQIGIYFSFHKGMKFK
jgi:hypothetical protein